MNDKQGKVWCYLRVSSDTQDVNSQKIGIKDFLREKGWSCHRWVLDEGVSGAVDWRKRKLGEVIAEAQKGDVIVFSEISRIARKLVLVLEVIKACTEKGVAIHTVKDRYVMEDTIQSKVLVTVMGLAAEIERDLIRQRTREGLKRVKDGGKTLGRPKGRRAAPESLKMHGTERDIRAMRAKGATSTQIAEALHVSRRTLARYESAHPEFHGKTKMEKA